MTAADYIVALCGILYVAIAGLDAADSNWPRAWMYLCYGIANFTLIAFHK